MCLLRRRPALEPVPNRPVKHSPPIHRCIYLLLLFFTHIFGQTPGNTRYLRPSVQALQTMKCWREESWGNGLENRLPQSRLVKTQKYRWVLENFLLQKWSHSPSRSGK